tara:strand:+ start:99 stop:689 length:591 start_codon:yes stop_codon:yes gene_type:complete
MSFFSTDEIALLQATVVRSDMLVKLDFVSGPMYMWNGSTELSAGGQTWLPMNGYGTISDIQFTNGSESERFTLSLDGVPDSQIEVISKALSATDEVDGQVATIYMQFFGEDWQPIGSPLSVKWGYMRKPRVSRSRIEGVDDSVQRVAIGCENIFYNRSLPSAGRYTDRDQQARYTGDLILQFQPGLLNKTFTYPDY